jgi:hypothetical protein
MVETYIEEREEVRKKEVYDQIAFVDTFLRNYLFCKLLQTRQHLETYFKGRLFIAPQKKLTKSKTFLANRI